MTADNLSPLTSDSLRSHQVPFEEPVRRQTLGDLLRRSAKRFPKKIAICGEKKWTYENFTLSVIVWRPVFRREASIGAHVWQSLRVTRMVLRP
jgi:hypothetical protein